MNEIEKYEKMLKDNNAAIKKLIERGKQIQAVIKLLKALSDKNEDVFLSTVQDVSRVENHVALDESAI